MNIKGFDLHKKVFVFSLKTVFFAALFLFLFLFILSLFVFKESTSYKTVIYPHVYVEGVDFGGKTKDDVVSFFNKKNRELSEVTLIMRYREQEATFSASLLSLKYDEQTAAQQAYSIGRSGGFFTQTYQKTAAIMNFGSFPLEAIISYNDEPIREYLQDLATQNNKPAQNALFQFEKGRVTAFRIEGKGIEIKSDQTLMEVKRALQSIKNAKLKKITIRVGEMELQPEVTLSEINNLGIEEKIGEGQSDYSGSIAGRIHNLLLAAAKINGTVIPRGEEFSYNKVVGDISAATGYQQAYIIKNGQTVLGDGGGVCQTSTTLFRAALDSGLPIVSRTAHAYRVHYYENDRKPGFDATVFQPSVDFKFRNNTPSPILIQMEVDKANRVLRFVFYGKKDGRVTTISSYRLWDVRPAPEARNQEDPTLPRGITKQVDWAAPGTKTNFHYKVERDGEVLEDQDFYSNFRPWQAIYLVGTGG